MTAIYPQNATMSRHQGMVLLYAIAGKDGSIQILKPISSPWPELETSAMKAVKDWKYSPYMRCGQAVENGDADQRELMAALATHPSPQK